MKRRKPNWWKLSALAAAMSLPGAGLAATFSADFFSAKGWVHPGEEYPFTLTYDAEGSPGLGTIQLTLPPEATFLGANAAYSQAGQTISFANLVGAGEIIVTARAADLNADPTIMWKNLSASATYSVGLDSVTAATLGPKVTTLDTARYGKRPFPLVMVEYQDIHHCTGNDERGGVSPDPFLECTANHSAEALDEAVNSRTSGRSLWQLYQDMSFGQLSPEGQVGPIPGTANTGYDPAYNFKFSTLQPSGACTGYTYANPATDGKGAPLPLAGDRIVDGWYRLPGSQGYYGADTTGHAAAGSLTGVGLLFGIDDACGPTAKITYDAAAIADPELDYNEFDTDKDGVVDFFNVAFAGEGGNGNVGTGANNVWPHKSDLQYYFTDENGEQGYVSNDQLKSHTGVPQYWTNAARNTMTETVTPYPVWVRVGPYNVNPEAAIEKMSVIAHEYGHSLGLPDFYSTGSRETFGSWELMASDHSQFMTVFTRQELGWIVPREAEDGSYTLRESKTDTGTIHWKTPDGTPYTLTGPGIHNADALKFPQPTIKLIDEVPSGVRAWHSGSGNDFGCPTTQGHNLDFFIPEMAQLAGANVELSFQSLYEIEWDWDYAFMMISTDGGATWNTVVSEEGTTLDGHNPNQAGCYDDLGNGITGSSRVNTTERNSLTNANRATGDLQPAEWITDRFDLSAYTGEEVIVRFGYFTDPAVANRGWFIDDIQLTADGETIYSSDFENDEHTRIFPDEWTRVSSADGVDADHAYYVEVRDRISWDFDGKDQSDRGAPTWEPGVAILYTDESHGYGNTGVDNPPAQTIVDSQPVPGDDTPDLNDAAFTAGSGDDQFDGCTHVDNYDTPAGDWKLPSGARVFVDSISGLSSNGVATGNALAQITVEANPVCDLNTTAPELAFGAGHSDPDPDGSYELTWIPTEGADGANQLQEATNLSVLLSDDAENDMSNWIVSDSGLVALPWSNSNPQSAARQHDGLLSFFTVVDDDARDTSSIMTWANDIAVPATGATVLSFYDSFGGELDDQGFVEVSTDNGVKWTPVYTTANPILIGLDGTFFDEPLAQKQVDLTPFAGETLQLRFRYYVGASNYLAYTPFGWWVDDVRIDTADWTDIAVTGGDSYVRSGLGDGHYYYRVRSSHTGAVPVYSNWSNIVETDVQRVNQNPVARDDLATTDQDTAVTVPVLDNDTDVDNDSLSVTSVGSAANGMTSFTSGNVTYTPNAGYVGNDSFTYTISDGNGGSAGATVNVTVNETGGGNTNPVADDDSASTTGTTPVTIDVLDGDVDDDGDTLSVSSVTQGANGSVVNNNVDVTYTANEGFVGTDSFEYTVSDGNGGSDTATVTVTVYEEVGENNDPTAVNDAEETDQGVAVTVDVLANDSDIDGDSLSVASVSQGSNGSVVINADDTVTYAPNAGFSGSDVFSYVVSDGNGGTATATVTITVLEEGANHAPKAKDDKAKTPKNTSIAIYVLTNDKDKDGDPLEIVEWTQGEHGSVHKGSNTTLVYVPDQDYTGNDEFTYTISDGRGGLDSAKVNVKVDKKDKDDDGSSDDQSSADDSSNDDHSSDDGSSRDDGCSRDADCDGISDASDTDDDNDGTPDTQDIDDDGDNIEDTYDSKGYDEVQGQSAMAPANSSVTFPLEVAPETASIFVVVRGANTEMMQVEILDSAGIPAGISISNVGELTSFADTFLIGTYTITITNPTPADIEFDYMTVRQQF